MKELISIIVPVYNSAKYIEDCIESVLEQTYTNFELILIDDGSKDCSKNICKRAGNKDSRIKVLEQKHKGVSAARNAGMNASQGKYIFFLDSDDAIHPKLLENLSVLQKKYHSDILTEKFRHVRDSEFQKQIKKAKQDYMQGQTVRKLSII